jgi:hypothetical protein
MRQLERNCKKESVKKKLRVTLHLDLLNRCYQHRGATSKKLIIHIPYSTRF